MYYWKLAQVIVAMLFIGQALLGFVMWIGVPVPLGPTGVGLCVLGFAGALAVIILNDAEERRDHYMTRSESLSQKVNTLESFIEWVVAPIHVADAFFVRKKIFFQLGQEQVRFYQKRDAAFAKLLAEHPDDVDLHRYQQAKEGISVEESMIRERVESAKKHFWDLRETVVEFNKYHFQAHEQKFAVPESIKMDDAEQERFEEAEKLVS